MQGETNSESTGRFNEVFDLLSTVRPELPNQIYVEVKVEKGDQRVAAQAYECLFAHLLWLGRISSKLEPAPIPHEHTDETDRTMEEEHGRMGRVDGSPTCTRTSGRLSQESTNPHRKRR